MRDLAAWESFYALMGSAAGALIGLQFVVMTLIAQRPPVLGREASFAFSTPTIVHFGMVLFLAALMSAPWPSIELQSTLLGLTGLGGFAYAAIVCRRMLTQTAYKPDREDWVFHALLPLAAYLVLAASAYETFSYPREAPFGIAAAALAILFTGIHNAWDATTFHVFILGTKDAASRKGEDGPTR